MGAWVTLAAAVAGAAIAIVGQYVTRRGENGIRRAELVLEQCSQLVALSEDFRNRVWEERELGQSGRVDDWNLAAYRLAAARLRILCGDSRVLAALDEMNDAGKKLGAYWRRGNVDPSDFEQRYERLKMGVEVFVAASATLVRRRLGRL